jgi:hypothetical protein
MTVVSPLSAIPPIAHSTSLVSSPSASPFGCPWYRDWPSIQTASAHLLLADAPSSFPHADYIRPDVARTMTFLFSQSTFIDVLSPLARCALDEAQEPDCTVHLPLKIGKRTCCTILINNLAEATDPDRTVRSCCVSDDDLLLDMQRMSVRIQ